MTISEFSFLRTKKHIWFYATYETEFETSHYHEHGQVRSDYTCCAKGWRFESHLHYLGLDNTIDTMVF